MLLATRGSGVSVFVAPIVGLLLISAGCMERWESRTNGVFFDPNHPLGTNDGGTGGAGGGGGGSAGEEISLKGEFLEPTTKNDQVEDIEAQAPIGGNALVRGTFESLADVDYYKVVLREDRHLSIKLFNKTGLCGNLNTKLRLFIDADPPSALLDGESIEGGDCAAITDFLKQGTYYIMAEHKESSVPSPLDYAIEFWFPDEQREDTTVLSSRHVVLSGSINSSSRIDVDVFDIELKEGESIDTEVRDVASADCKGFSSRLLVERYNGSGWDAFFGHKSSVDNCVRFRSSEHPDVWYNKGGKFKITVSKPESGETPDFNYKLFMTVRSDNWMTSWSETN